MSKNGKKVQGVSWVFTLNNPSLHGYDKDEVISEFEICGKVRYAIFSLEQGESGTPHFQGFVKMYKNTALGYFKNFMGGKAHWEVGLRNSDDLCRMNYVKKAPIEGPWEFGSAKTEQGRRTDLESALEEPTIEDVAKKHPEVFCKYSRAIREIYEMRTAESSEAAFKEQHEAEVAKFDNWLPWQEDCIYLCNTQPDRRTIHWMWEETGNVGKSTIGDHLIVEYGAIVLCGKVSDMRYAYAQKRAPVVIFDLCRTQVDCMQHFAHFCEELKNGRYMNTKYKSEMVLFRVPHLFVFANFAYPGGYFSSDRVKCFDVSKYGACKY